MSSQQPDPDPDSVPRAGAAAPSPRGGAARKKWILGGVAGVALLGLGGVVAAVNAGGDDKPEAATVTESAATSDEASAPASKADPATATGAPATPITGANPPPAEPTTVTRVSPGQHSVETEPQAGLAGGAGFGNSVRDGDLEFTVAALDCSRTRVGTELRNTTARGKFCIVSVTVKNISGDVQSFDGSLQRAISTDGTEFASDGAAEIYANGNNSVFLSRIKPGNRVKGKLVFDVSQSTTLTAIELRDAYFSRGVTVSLR